MSEFPKRLPFPLGRPAFAYRSPVRWGFLIGILDGLIYSGLTWIFVRQLLVSIVVGIGALVLAGYGGYRGAKHWTPEKQERLLHGLESIPRPINFWKWPRKAPLVVIVVVPLGQVPAFIDMLRAHAWVNLAFIALIMIFVPLWFGSILRWRERDGGPSAS